ncbi:MAG: hybrid sensor histidine kinase/response regulator [Muribaculaceae bacterium]
MEIIPSEYKILIVDDILSNVVLMQTILKHLNYNIITALCGMQGLEKIENEKPDLVLLDVMMPDINGYDVAKRAKANPETKDIPIIFVTALNEASNVVEGFKNGGNDYIIKPFKAEEIITRVSHQLAIVASRRIILQQTEELQKVIQGRDRLYSVIAHDLRSPLGSMKMALNMMVGSINKEEIGEDMYELLTSTDQTTEELFTLLDNLLKWTKNQLGKLNVVTQYFEFTDLISGVCEILKPLASLNGIKLNCNTNDKVYVNADIDMIKTVIRNLILNALKFSHNDYSIDIKVYNDGTNAICDVIDHGIGISDENQTILRSADHLTTLGARQEEGSGLGLQLCREFTQKNNGTFWFTSKQGEGSTFSFSLPIASKPQ